MSEKLDRKLKLALDETRLLILGVQIVLGFEFQGIFQDAFESLPASAKGISLVSLCLIVLSVILLIAPSMQHRMVERGQTTPRLIAVTNKLAGLALLPLTAGLALSTYIVTDRIFGSSLAAGVSAFLGVAATFFWFGLELIIGHRNNEDEEMTHSPTPIKTKIEQLLTEARLIIPGGQALFGFQLVAMLTSGFDRLPDSAKLFHTIALCLVGMNIILMMTPAALHRLSFGGEDSAEFLRLGSAFVIAGPVFLAAGISAEFYVVFMKSFSAAPLAISGSVGAFLVAAGFWYAWPLALVARSSVQNK
jgi:hypothetical protein